MPVAGFLVGLAGGAAYWLANRLHVQPEPACVLALVATALFTGAMHEDGLADAVDGLGGKTPEQRLEIMRDSRIGTFGVCALLVCARKWNGQTVKAQTRNLRARCLF